MRFAYIDSQGNEVPIPSVEALALRIELGAIGPDTQLYDAAADRWGPAHTHDVFHTLSRAKEEEGFIAPPPPPAPPPSSGEQQGGPEDESAAEAAAEQDRTTVSDGPTLPGESEDTFDLPADLDLTLIEPGSTVGEDASATRDLSLPPSPFEPFGPSPFDIVDEPAPEPEQGSEPGAEPGHADAGTGEPPVEEEMDFSGFGGGFAAPLELEKPMSEFTPDAPPAWMEQEGPESSGIEEEERILDFSQPPVGPSEEARVPPPPRTPGAGADRPPAGRPVPRSRPSPPRRPRRHFRVGALLALVVLAGIGAGGWYAWSVHRSREAAEEAAAKAAVPPPVRLPPIPAGMETVMRKLGEAALSHTVARFRTEEAAFGLPAEPDKAWLGGDYLANPNRYPDVRRYWVLVDSFFDDVRGTDARVFHEEYARELDSAGIHRDTASMLLARADSGFLATRPARLEAYAEVHTVASAALALHRFLLAHVGDIVYTPAAGGVSKDPVLEAMPKTPALGRQMWGMVDSITGALNTLGTLDKVTTDHLSSALFAKVRAAGFK